MPGLISITLAAALNTINSQTNSAITRGTPAKEFVPQTTGATTSRKYIF
jgi:hypothetical protein